MKEKYRPSNGTDGMWFEEKFCMQCRRCNPDAFIERDKAKEQWVKDKIEKDIKNDTNKELFKSFNLEKPSENVSRINFEKDLQIQNLSFSYGPKKNHVFKNFNYVISTRYSTIFAANIF